MSQSRLDFQGEFGYQIGLGLLVKLGLDGLFNELLDVDDFVHQKLELLVF